MVMGSADRGSSDRVKESKQDARLFFLPEKFGGSIVGPFAAVVHLFEHSYDGRHVFWYGVGDVAGEPDDFRDPSARLGSPLNPSGGYGPHPIGARMRIELEDGRQGVAVFQNCQGRLSDSDGHYELCFFGQMPLGTPGVWPESGA